MLDFFVIFSKGGIILWYFQSTKDAFVASINTLVKTVILQERTSIASFESLNWRLKHRLDNEYQLVFVVGFQKILQLSYVDKLLDDVHREFRDKYINQLITRDFHHGFAFDACFSDLLSSAEAWARSIDEKPRAMRSFDQSQKSQKTLASMIEKRAGSSGTNQTKGKSQGTGDSKNKEDKVSAKANAVSASEKEAARIAAAPAVSSSPKAGSGSSGSGSPVSPDTIAANRRKMAAKAKKKGLKSPSGTSGAGGKKTKAARVWALSGTARDAEQLDFSETLPAAGNGSADNGTGSSVDQSMVGSMVGNIQDLDADLSDYDDEESDEDEEAETAPRQNGVAGKKSAGGMLSMFRGLVGSKTLTQESIAPALTKLKDHLVGKNVAADIAAKLCDSVAAKLEGRVLGTFEGVSNTVRATLIESLTHVLSPRRRVDILHDVLRCRQARRPFTMAMCGVNGVGKSTNLAKICFWLIENGFSVLIAACDTFRSGAVEQLRTHVRHLNALHPAEKHAGRVMVQLYEKGYGKDPAGVAADAISAARDSCTDVVLIDTAGRMQDNEPLMRALAKLVKVNDPDLVLFVGEALVGNEAVDQLVKFDRALADYSTAEQPHTIDGIVLTKFDTIDDKVGAAISMTYVTGQPIVFVGCGQTYRDLRKLNADAVVSALMK